MKIRYLIPLLLSASLYAQSGILASSRQPPSGTSWPAAGLPATFPDGETTTNPWTPPTRPACTSGQAGTTVPIPSSASVSTINSALAACAAANTSGSYLLLGSGTFSISSTLEMWNMWNVTLRGGGPQSTILNLSSGVSIAMGGANGAFSGTLSGSIPAGTSTITITGATGTPQVGMSAVVSQCDTGSGSQPCSTAPSDNGGLFVCGDYDPCQDGSDSASTYAHQTQTIAVTSVTNNGGGSYTLGITPALYMPNWTTGSGAILSWQTPSWDANGLGLEDLTVEAAGGADATNYLVQMGTGYASWIKGVRFVGAANNSQVGLTSNVVNSLVFNNYFAPSQNLSTNYPYGLFGTSLTQVLILNNIFAQGLPIELQGGNVGTVTAYNFARDGFTLYPFNLVAFDHHAFSSFDLWEGNQAAQYLEDNTWGSHALNTYFRNNIQCNDSPYVGTYSQGNNYNALSLSNYQRFENIIGNAMGTNITECGTYQSTGYNSIYSIATGDSLVASTLMRWGNVSVVQQSSDTPANSGKRFVSSEVPFTIGGSFQNAVPANDNLGCSWYFSVGSSPCTPMYSGGTGLNFYKVCTAWSSFPTSCSSTQTPAFPIAGPELTSGPYVNGYAYDNPAATAWKYLPVDTGYQGSYTISGSSWTGGVETLTISTSFPSSSAHIMGAFQLSGVNSACTTGATFGNNSEILMTGSTLTPTQTVSYALASNPGVSCTGAMLFPDIRQFDERVYEADSGGTSYTLSLSKTGNGASGCTLGGTAAGSYPSGTLVTITESCSPNYVFTTWGGNCSAFNTCSFNLTSNQSVSANFVTTSAQYLNLDTLTPASSPGGSSPGWNINDTPADTGGVNTPASTSQTIGNSSPAGGCTSLSMLTSETTIATSTQTNTLFWYYGAGSDSSTNFIADVCIYVSGSDANNIEIDHDQYNVTVNRLFSYGAQYNVASGCWQYANNSSSWQTTTACPSFALNTWHHVIIATHRVNGDTACSGEPCDYYDSITEDGITYTINGVLESESLGGLPTALVDQVQVNAGPTSGTPATVSYSLENMDFSGYNPNAIPSAPTNLIVGTPL